MGTSVLPPLGSGLPDQLVLLGVGIVAIVLLISSIRKRQNQLKQPTPPRPASPPRAASPGNPEASMRRDLNELMVELQELSRRISAEIDTRFAKLEAAIRDADRRIVVLNRLSRQAAGGAAEPSNALSGHDIRHTVVYELADAGLTPIEIARDLGKTPGEVELILNLRKQTAT